MDFYPFTPFEEIGSALPGSLHRLLVPPFVDAGEVAAEQDFRHRYPAKVRGSGGKPVAPANRPEGAPRALVSSLSTPEAAARSYR